MNYFERFKRDFQKVTVTEYENNVPCDIDISVCIMTYNQIDYLEECLNGVLNQKTMYKYEIILGDDESTDGTRELCLKYAKLYPDKIRLLFHCRGNNIKVNGNPTGQFNLLYNLFSSRGRYVALCEGDDYWIDSNKLQNQINLLEKYSNLIGCFTNYTSVDKQGSIIKLATRSENHVEYYDFMGLLESGLPQTCTVVYRNKPSVFFEVSQVYDALNSDQLLATFMARHGLIKYLSDVTACRRFGSGMFSTLKRTQQLFAGINTYIALKSHLINFDELNRVNFRISRMYSKVAILYILDLKLKKVFNLFIEHKKTTGFSYYYIFKNLVNQIFKSFVSVVSR